MPTDTLVRIQGNPVIMIYNAPPQDNYSPNLEDTGSKNTPDASLELQGHRIQLTETDGVFAVNGLAISITQNTSASDPYVELQGVKLRIHSTGNSLTIGGVSRTLHAFCYDLDSNLVPGVKTALLEWAGARMLVADTIGDGKFVLIFATGSTNDQSGTLFGLRINKTVLALPGGVTVPSVGGIVPTVYDSIFNGIAAVLDSESIVV